MEVRTELTDKERYLTMRYSDVMTPQMIAARLGVSVKAVLEEGKVNDEIHFIKNAAFLDDEIRYLKKYHDVKSTDEIAARLGRPAKIVENQLKEMGLSAIIDRESRYRKWTQEEEIYLREKINNQPIEETAAELERTKTEILAKARRMRLAALDSVTTVKKLRKTWGLTSYQMEKCLSCGLPYDTRKILGENCKIVDNEKLSKWVQENTDMLADMGVVVQPLVAAA